MGRGGGGWVVNKFKGLFYWFFFHGRQCDPPPSLPRNLQRNLHHTLACWEWGLCLEGPDKVGARGGAADAGGE